MMALNLGKPNEVSWSLALVNPNVAIQVVNKWQRDKLGKVSQTLGRVLWTLNDF